jgi:hypothetical protein
VSNLLNDEGVTRDDVKFWMESVRFLDTPAYARLDVESQQFVPR